MGWNTLWDIKPSELMRGIDESHQFYFVHTYSVHCDSKNSLARCHYGELFDAGVFNENIFGLQFHPETSHDAGLQIIKNFQSL